MNNISKSLLSKCDQNNTLEAYEIGYVSYELIIYFYF